MAGKFCPHTFFLCFLASVLIFPAKVSPENRISDQVLYSSPPPPCEYPCIPPPASDINCPPPPPSPYTPGSGSNSPPYTPGMPFLYPPPPYFNFPAPPPPDKIMPYFPYYYSSRPSSSSLPLVQGKWKLLFLMVLLAFFL
ncbi:hypothetical protein AMTRI_Chr13g117810 [Amborella trichopoda]